MKIIGCNCNGKLKEKFKASVKDSDISAVETSSNVIRNGEDKNMIAAIIIK